MAIYQNFENTLQLLWCLLEKIYCTISLVTDFKYCKAFCFFIKLISLKNQAKIAVAEESLECSSNKFQAKLPSFL
jgi:hypothetical protein